MRRVIRLGDPTSHGGKVASAAGNYTIMGKNVARLGDVCTCPIPGHNNCTIAEGDPTHTIDGRPVAYEGHKTSCGATLISTCGQWGRSYEGHAGAVNGQLIQSPPPTVDTNAANKVMTQAGDYDEQVRLMMEATHAQGVPYFIETPDGRVVSGNTDGQGTMPRINMEEAGSYQVFLYDEALARMDGHHGSK